MWIPRNTKTRSGFFLGITASLLSFIAIHALFIAAHELVDESTPSSTLAYLIDRNMEPLENGISHVRGTDAVIRTYTLHAQERVEELEHVFDSDTDNTVATSLLNDAYASMEHAVDLLEEYIGQEQNDLTKFTLSLFVESAAEDITRRLMHAKEYVQDSIGQELTATIDNMEQLIERSVIVTTQFTVEETVATQIRSQVIQDIQQVRTPNIPKDAELSCGTRNTECGTNEDCCSALGLTCNPVILSDGSRSKRCMVTPVHLCSISCRSETNSSEGRWQTPRGCAMNIAPPGTPDCDELTGNTCRVSGTASRNTRYCIDT